MFLFYFRWSKLLPPPPPPPFSFTDLLAHTDIRTCIHIHRQIDRRTLLYIRFLTGITRSLSNDTDHTSDPDWLLPQFTLMVLQANRNRCVPSAMFTNNHLLTSRTVTIWCQCQLNRRLLCQQKYCLCLLSYRWQRNVVTVPITHIGMFVNIELIRRDLRWSMHTYLRTKQWTKEAYE